MYEEERRELLDTCLKMLELDLLAGSAGNASVRVDDHAVITPSSVPYIEMKPEDMMVLDLEGNVVEGDLNPSVEHRIHLALYRNRDDAQAVLHPHSVYATALALLQRPLPPILDEVVPKLGGEIRVTSYAMPGSTELANEVVGAIEDRSAVLIANHGALVIGSSLSKALSKSLLLERTCRIYLIALQAGKPTELPEEIVEMEQDLWDLMK
ncbi:MAG: class II aldolase/adducin family protein [Candidatus Thorarchaeota archaeon]|nr:MAG: class II aldolase/adducin family protein [Candidatus Thorarchaeota archaeon]